jgi:predicted nucleotidyltransferase
MTTHPRHPFEDVGRDPRLREIAAAQPYPLLFATVSGAHLYGFPSPDSDYDLRGVHLLPAEAVVGLDDGPDTLEIAERRPDLDLDLVTHDVKKFFALLVRRNGYVLEQLTSPLVVHTTPEHEELKALVPGLVTRHHRHHYRGFAESQWELFCKDHPPRVKPLLYVYRVLLTGIHLMRSGEVEANLLALQETFGLPYLPSLIERKAAGPEKGGLPEADLARHHAEFRRLIDLLETSAEASHLPEAPTARPALHDLLVRLRLRGLARGGGG